MQITEYFQQMTNSSNHEFLEAIDIVHKLTWKLANWDCHKQEVQVRYSIEGSADDFLCTSHGILFLRDKVVKEQRVEGSHLTSCIPEINTSINLKNIYFFSQIISLHVP